MSITCYVRPHGAAVRHGLSMPCARPRAPRGGRTLAQNNITGEVPCPERFDEALAAFEHALFSRGMAEATVHSYGSSLRLFGRFYTEALKKPGPFVPRLQETDLLGFVDYLRRDRLLKAASLNRNVAALRAFSDFVLRKGWHRRALAEELRPYRLELAAAPPRLSDEERRRLLAMVDLNRRNGHRNRAIVELLLQAGLRVGELVALSRDDVTLLKSTGRVRVRSDKVHGERSVPLKSTTRTALDNYLARRGPVAGHEPLFVSERRQRLSVSAVQQLIKRLLEAIGRDDLSTHALRHDFAQRFHARSGKLTATQQVLGHRSISSTVRYARASDREIEDAIEQMDEP